jgi:hypothetical protein
MRVQVEPCLFIAVMPGGITYCDSSREVNGDYKHVAFLPYDSLELAIKAPRSKLLPEIKKHASEMKAKEGQMFQIALHGNNMVRLGKEA